VDPKPLIKGILLILILNLLQAYFTTVSEDEAYYWLWSQNPDWGYFDHPPMVAWWIAAGYSVFQNELGLRLLTVVLNAGALFFFWKILKPETERQVRLFWISVFSVVVVHVFGFLTTPDAPLLFFTLLYLYVLQEFISAQNLRHTLLLGLAMAGLMYSKYHGILVILFTLALLLTGGFYRKRQLYYAVFFGILLYLPHIVWLFAHDFIPVHYHFFERSADEHFEWRKLFNYLGMYFLGASPLLSYFIIKSIVEFRSKDLFRRSVWCLAVFPGVFFFFSIFKDNVQPQWLLVSFVAMALLFYWNYSGKENLKWVFGLGWAGIILVLVFRILVAVPSVSPFSENETFARNVAKFRPVHPVFEKYQEASVYTFFYPDQTALVHRTLGNRKSQFDLWNLQESVHGKTVTYISPWTISFRSFRGYKDRKYYLKEIENYETFHLIEVKTLSHLSAKPDERINLGIKISNHHDREIAIGGNSELQFSVNYYQDFQYNVLYNPIAEITQILLAPGEEIDIQVSFNNVGKPGNYKVCVGLTHAKIGTTYVSNIINLEVSD